MYEVAVGVTWEGPRGKVVSEVIFLSIIAIVSPTLANLTTLPIIVTLVPVG